MGGNAMYKLRELQRSDLLLINKWRNNPDLIRLLGAPFRYINLDVEQNWYDNYMANRGSAVRCAIIDEQDAETILGLVSLTNIDYMNQSANLHIMIGDECNQGKGIGTFAVSQMLCHAFQNMNLHRISLSVLNDNLRAIRLYEKVGFCKEGIRRESLYKNGEFVDLMEYAILKSEFTRGGVFNKR